MQIDRRQFLKLSGAVVGGLALPASILPAIDEETVDFEVTDDWMFPATPVFALHCKPGHELVFMDGRLQNWNGIGQGIIEFRLYDRVLSDEEIRQAVQEMTIT